MEMLIGRAFMLYIALVSLDIGYIYTFYSINCVVIYVSGFTRQQMAQFFDVGTWWSWGGCCNLNVHSFLIYYTRFVNNFIIFHCRTTFLSLVLPRLYHTVRGGGEPTTCF